MRLCVMGTGYVGLVAGSCFSDSGNHVTCVDVAEDKINRLNKGEIPIYEPGLEEIIARNAKGGRLKFSTDAKGAIESANAVFIAVGTPQGADGSSNLDYVRKAVATIRDSIKQETLVVLKSTVPVGTADEVRRLMQGAKAKFEVVSNPEFLKEGTAVNDFLKPERVVIGCETDWARRWMTDLYAPYVRSGNPIYFMSNRSAELSKYAANAFLAMKISYINDMAQLAEKIGAEIHDVRKAIISDSRIGNKFLYPGCGYGGSCFPKDVLALVHLGKEYKFPLELFRSVHDINERQKRVIFDKVKKHFNGQLKGKTLTVWGLAFKPQTDDMREAPAVTLITNLLESGCRVRAYDPVANHEARRYFENKVELFTDGYEALKGSDGLAIMTEWNEFRSPDFQLIKKELSRPVVFDGRNIYSPESMKHLGFAYYCIGTPDPKLT
jgi:UDPglucose 6-dehydrogenase